MARYGLNTLQGGGTSQAITTTFKSNVTVTAATGGPVTRGTLVDVHVGPSGPPNATDCSIVYDISRCTTGLGTGTAATPVPVDNLSGACATVGTTCLTAEPTITANSSLWSIALNQRSSIRIFFDQGLHWPAVNLSGLAVRALSPTTTGTVNAQVYFDE